ncbi:MAG: glucose 1-dehydrogenase [Anaerolineae bacterium]|nr:glucose 1-dehydrogenase [Anaerolineae bacterium]
MKLNNKIAVITGAGSGFGEGMAKHFAANGATVVVADVVEAAAARVATEIAAAGGKAIPITMDVSKNVSVGNAVKQILAQCGTIDIWVNNAGISHKNGPMLNVDETTFDRVYAVNVKSLYLSAMHVVPVFRTPNSDGTPRGGVFLNIASTAGVRPRPGLTWYNGTKGAAITITKSMAVELAPDKIRVNAINPVAGETPLLKQFLPGDDTPEIRQKFINTIPLGRLSQPLDIARAALFLVSDDAEFITGVCMEVDGGRCI